MSLAVRRFLFSGVLLWVTLFLGFAAGLVGRDAAFEHGPVAGARVLHHRLARILSLPLSRAVRSQETGTLRRMAVASLWGASLWTGLAGGLVFLWMRAGKATTAATQPPDGIGGERKFSRRDVLRAGVGGVPLVGGGAAAFSILIEPSRLRIVEYEATIHDLPADLEGLLLAHLSDFHLGDYIGLDHVRRSIAMANEAKPDLALLTGDYVQGTHKAFEPMARILAEELRPAHGTLATLGNHDHWHAAARAREIFAAHSVPLIDNNRRFFSRGAGLTAEVRPDSICIAGVGDYWEDEVDFIRALEGVAEKTPRIVLSHNPDVAEMFAGLKEEAKRRSGAPSRLDLMLSGHTHGGQVRLPFMGTPVLPSRYGQKYAGGRVEGPDWPVIVSRGIGMALLPVRFAVRPEVVLVRLRRGVMDVD